MDTPRPASWPPLKRRCAFPGRGSDIFLSYGSKGGVSRCFFISSLSRRGCDAGSPAYGCVRGPSGAGGGGLGGWWIACGCAGRERVNNLVLRGLGCVFWGKSLLKIFACQSSSALLFRHWFERGHSTHHSLRFLLSLAVWVMSLFFFSMPIWCGLVMCYSVNTKLFSKSFSFFYRRSRLYHYNFCHGHGQ